MSKLYLFAFLLLVSQVVTAQNKVLDSLNKELKHSKKSAAEQTKINLDLGSEYYNVSAFDASLACYERAIKSSSILRDTATLIQALSMKGRILSDKGENPLALHYYQKALNLAEASNNLLLLAYLQRYIGVLYINWKNFDAALKHYHEAQKIAIKLNKKDLVADCDNNKATVYEQLLDYPKASYHYQRALNYYLKTNNKKGIATCYTNMAIVFKSQKKYQNAIEYNFKSLTIIRDLGNKWIEAATLNNIGSVYYSMGKYSKTITYCEQALEIAESIKSKEIAVACYETLADAAAKLKDYESAYHYRVNFHKLDKEFINAEKTKQFSELEIKYNTVKREKQISLLHKQNIIQQLSISRQKTTLGIVIGAMIAIIIIGLLLFNRNRLKQQAHLRNQELIQRETLTQSVISAEENERKRIASDLHDGLGQLLSAVKMNLSGLIDRIIIEKDSDKFLAENTLALVDESCREVRHISHQMMPGASRKSGIAVNIAEFVEKLDAESLKIDLRIEGFSETLEGSEEITLYRVIQEAINNVIKHSGATNLVIQLVKTRQAITVILTDNGKGFDTSKAYEGMGLKNIITRVGYLKGTVDFDSKPGEGTTMRVDIPW